jgi:FO synthase
MLPDTDLLKTPLAELAALARSVRDEAHGRRVTFSPKVFIPLTMLCRDRCGYCTFAKAPSRLAAPYLTPDEVLAIARAGRDAGCHEALFTLGERPELRYPVARDWLAAHGFASTVDYLAEACRLVLDETGLLPHANAGALFADELARLRPVAASQGMMLESLAEGLAAHRGAPDKEPARRLATLEAAGELSIPFTTGILVGIGDDRAGQLRALHAIAEAHARHGHVQEVIVQNFLPKPGTAMAKAAPCPAEDLQWAIAAARLVLPPEVHVQAPPNLSDDLAPLLDAGIDDWGGVSPVTADHVNPERAWPALRVLREATEAAGHVLAARLTVYPAFALEPERWLDPALRFGVLDVADAEGLARDGAWCSGGEEPPPSLLDEATGTGERPVAAGAGRRVAGAEASGVIAF